ncbi:MAG: hypothetical protein ACR2OA_10930, partial [Rubripirellula sp.]
LGACNLINPAMREGLTNTMKRARPTVCYLAGVPAQDCCITLRRGADIGVRDRWHVGSLHYLDSVIVGLRKKSSPHVQQEYRPPIHPLHRFSRFTRIRENSDNLKMMQFTPKQV